MAWALVEVREWLAWAAGGGAGVVGLGAGEGAGVVGWLGCWRWGRWRS